MIFLGSFAEGVNARRLDQLHLVFMFLTSLVD